LVMVLVFGMTIISLVGCSIIKNASANDYTPMFVDSDGNPYETVFGRDSFEITHHETTSDGSKDSISISTVIPNTNLIDGEEQEFVITIEYILSTMEQGQLIILFNDYVYDSWGRSNSRDIIVDRGSGTVLYNVTVRPKNWFPEGDFSVISLLYDNDFNILLANSDETVLSFK